VLKEELQTTATSNEFEIPVQLFAMDGARETFSARIRRVNSGFFQLRITMAVDIGRKLVMHYDTCRVELEVLYCQSPGIGPYYVGAKVLNLDESAVRKEIRLPVDILAKVSVPGHLDHDDARIIDMSSSGLGLVVPRPVDVDCVIAVDTGLGIAFGEVRHCTKTPNGDYRIGISLEEFLTRDHPLVLKQGTRELFSLLRLLRKLKESLFTH
jgi:hypothetical protein